ncbi:hypothetical protein QZH41_017114, partial [Actinostola sp. cb2023]
MAYEERIQGYNLPDDKPILPIADLPNSSFLPSPEEHKQIKNDFVVLILRVLTSTCEYFKQYSNIVPKHIPHKNSDIMKEPTEIVHLGLLEKNENSTQDMVDILKHINENYVPIVQVVNDDGEEEINIARKIMFGEDQLTVERSRGAIAAVADSESPFLRMEGIIPKAEDFHCEMQFLQMVFSYMYREESRRDKGTLFQLKTALNRKDVRPEVVSLYSILWLMVISYMLRWSSL